MKYRKVAFMASGSLRSKDAITKFQKQYGTHEIAESDVLVTLGGDGFLLEVLHQYPDLHIPIFGMNRGTLGFLLNEYEEEDLLDRINASKDVYLTPVTMEATNTKGEKTVLNAFNEVSVIRYSGQSANLSIRIDGKMAMEKLSCDGVLVSTPAGSTAYNLSAHGPVIPLNSNLLALTPVSPFRPRRWKGALLPDDVVIEIENLDPVKRPIGTAADSREVNDCVHIKVWQDEKHKRHLLFDPARTLEERIMYEQFSTD